MHMPRAWVCVDVDVDLSKSPHGFSPAISALKKNVFSAPSWSPQWVYFFVRCVEKWKRLIMHDSSAPARRREGVLMLEACSESQGLSLDLMFGVCLWMRSCVCVYLCLMQRLIKEIWGSERRLIGYQESADRHVPRARMSHVPSHLSCFFFRATCFTLFTHYHPSCGHNLFPLFSFSQSLPSLFLSSHFPFLSLPACLSIFTLYPPSPSPLLPSLPLCLCLSSSDRLLMQALYESISPSAVVELAPLLRISSSAFQIQPDLAYACMPA